MSEKKVRFIETWEEWKEHWEVTHAAELLLGLLHIGWDIPMPEGEGSKQSQERVCFYLDVANIDNNEPDKYPFKVRRKAFEVLATKFFKGTASVTNSIRNTEVCDKLLWFFRTDLRSLTIITPLFPNLDFSSSTHHLKSAKEFLFRFAKELYLLARAPLPNAETYRRQAIEILWGLDAPYSLLDVHNAHTDEVCLKTLREISLRGRSLILLPQCGSHALGKWVARRPESPEDALFSERSDIRHAAEALTVLHARAQAHQEHLEKIAELELQHAETGAKLQSARG